MKPKKLKKRIQQLEKRLQEDTQKLARLRRKLQESEISKSVESCEKIGCASYCVSRKAISGANNRNEETERAKKAKRKLNLSPERRAQLAATMKARWAAKRAAEGNSTASSDQNSPTPPTQPPENRADGA